MEIRIENAENRDLAKVIDLVREFAEYEDLLDYCQVTAAKLADVVFGPEAFVKCMVARDGTEVIGYALYYPNFASFRGQRGIYLEDIFVRKEYRGRRVGDDMLKAIARESKSAGFERIDFQVLEWNKPAIGFYFKHGAIRDDDERHFKFVDEAFARLAS
jgi:ribosomal protein S18 acetylase RimI-like enzyme